MTEPENLRTGLLVLHGNRLEDLAGVVLQWLADRPLAPLEEETLLVQSNGMAEWLKMALASHHGVCAAARIELPARFIWRAYRAVLGRDAVPALSPLDKQPLTWRLMALLPVLQHQPVFAPVAGFLAAGDADAARRLQLAQRLADLFDAYQVYRSDWLHDWAAGRDTLRDAHGQARPVPADQAWQPALWRAVQDTLPDATLAASRPELHQRFMAALQTLQHPPPGLPRRVVLFGTTHIPHQTLEAIAALARHCQVLLAVPNPCRFHWADIIEGRELLRAERRRQALRGGQDLARLPLQEMHAHGHPLLAAWGRQSRDFIRQLDAFDDAETARRRFALARVDLFDSGDGSTLLHQVQAHMRELRPLGEHTHRAPQDGDRSIVFHMAHSAQREVEILHDQLLQLLAQPREGQALNPRDIVVMVPDIDAFAPAIRSVFGQHARHDPRHIPWGMADLKDSRHNPLLVALQWLLRAPQQRFTASEVCGLLEVPALARRFGLREGDLPTLAGWIADAGVRWGLDEAQRGTLGLQACGATNSWAFGLQRMLLGYAAGALAVPAGSGEAAAEGGFAGIEPCTEVAGLSAGLAGTLAELLQRLQDWWRDAFVPRTPAAWAERLRLLLPALFAAGDEAERATLSALDDALARWLQACDAAAFEEPVPLAVLREAWLEAIDEPGLSQRFKAGGVTFCTLLPLRAIPFEVVCLLGMNDGDYPRRTARSDFDLMALPGQARPGDRSRRDDDRQLMLDALLSARRVLYVSWVGRSQRDNEPQPPSVLVAQLRDYLQAGWSRDAVAQRTTAHPLQPFSRAYFESEGTEALFTYAGEWRAAHDAAPAHDAGLAEAPQPAAAEELPAVSLDELVRFVRNPVKAFFRHRLNVVFDEAEADAEDDEAFESGGLQGWSQLDDVLREARRQLDADGSEGASLAALVQAQVAALQRAGRLPLGGPGSEVQAALQRTLQPMLVQWLALRQAHPQRLEKQPLRAAHPLHPALRLQDWLVGLRRADGESAPLWIELQASRIADKSGKHLRQDKLVVAWLRCLAAAACGVPVRGVIVGSDVCVQVHSVQTPAEALATLAGLLQAYAHSRRASEPWPTAVRTGLAWLDDRTRAAAAYEGGQQQRGEGQEACLARLFPDFAALSAAPGFEAATQDLYGALHEWLNTGVSFQRLPDAAPEDEAEDDD